jgi:hypothetical protein
MNRNAQMSPLLCLPAELRNEIWGYALYEGTYDFMKTPMTRRLSRHAIEITVDPILQHWLGLISTRRQTYAEAALLPVSLSTFSLATNRT